MRKQVTYKIILLTACLVFALALSGTVTAEDSQGSGLDDSSDIQISPGQSNAYNNSYSMEDDPRIYGVIKENTTPVQGAMVIVKNPTNNSIITSGITNSSGEYDISFFSNLTEFNVEISYSSYKTFITTVKPTGLPIPTAKLNHTFMPSQMLKTTKMMILLRGYGYTPVERLLESYEELLQEGYDFDLRCFYLADLSYNTTILEQFTNELKNTTIIYFPTIQLGPFSYQTQQGTELSAIIDQSLPITSRIVLGSTGNSAFYTGTRNVTSFPYGLLSSYSKETIKKLILSVLKLDGAIANSTNTTFVGGASADMIYHPDANQTFNNTQDYLQWYSLVSKLKPNAANIGIVFDSSQYESGDTAVIDALIRALELKGGNVIALMQYSPFFPGPNRFRIYDEIFTVNGTPLISALIINSHQSGVPASIQLYTKLNVPVFGALMVGQTTLNEYLTRMKGLTGGYEFNIWTVSAEQAGRVANILVGGLEVASVNPLTGTEIKLFAAYQPGINQLSDMALAWANLKMIDNSQKKVALVYVDNTHDERMPVAGSLNLPESLVNILSALQNAGYNLGSLTNPTATELLNMINDHGRNLVNYTDKDLANLIQKGAITVSCDEYLQWYSQLPKSLKDQLEAVWGPAPGNLMIYQNQIIIPGISLGNIFLGPQPIWKWNGTLHSLYNNENLPPTHQYVAFYLWLQKKFIANAYVQLGDHGTLELLPGHSMGMTEDDWPNTLIGHMPHIYIRSMVGEDATAAKRRAYAVIITHLIPVVTQTEWNGSQAEMHDFLDAYSEAYDRDDTQRMDILKNQIWKKINAEPGLSERLGINSATNFGVVWNKLHDYLHSLQNQLVTHGLHTFGELPDSEIMAKFIDAIISFDPTNRIDRRDEIRDLLYYSGENEMKSLLNALNGGYIVPGPAGDPVRSLETLPSGRNKYNFDPRRVPDVAATIIGQKSVNEMLNRYLEANGNKYPETVGIPVSGGEVMVTYGQSIASIFHLLGVKAVYKSNIVVDTEVIPINELKRPRIDVLIQISTSFRDACPDVARLLDETVKKVAMLDEPLEMNYVRKHYLSLLTQLKQEIVSQGTNIEDAESLAERLARSRIFGLPPGADPHGVGVGRLIHTTTTWTESELAETYLDYNSYIYGNNIDGFSGLPGRMVMEKLMRSVDTTMAMIYSPMSGQVGFSGSAIMTNVVNYLTGKKITNYVIRTSDGNPKAFTLEEAMYDGLTLTLFDPKWKESMMKEGYSGHATIALRIRSVYVTDVLSGVVNTETWQKIADTYLFDQKIYSQMDPSAARMIANVIYQANNRGLMRLSSAQANQLAKIMGIPVSDPGSKPKSGSATSSSSVTGHTGYPGEYQSSSIGDTGQQAVESHSDTGTQTPGDSGKSYEVTKTTSEGINGTPWGIYAVAGILSILALAGIGFFYKNSLFNR